MEVRQDKENPALTNISKGQSSIHKAAKEYKLYDKLPDHKIKKWIQDKEPVTIAGPYNRQVPPTNFIHAFGITISTYPQYYGRKTRDGDPVCDSYRVQVHKNLQVICVADGCGWGEQARQASNRLKDQFVSYFTEKVKSLRSLKEIGEHLVTAIAYANYYISYDKKNIWMAGTTTALGGLLVELDTSKDSTLPPWAFVFISIGDCKCFKFDKNTQTCEDVTIGNRMNITDARDPGGRLGPHNKNGDPDLRNLDMYWVGCNPGDIIIALSDGVHDNLDPQSLGIPPSDFGIDADNWDDVETDRCTKVKTEYMNEYITKIILGSGKEDNEATNFGQNSNASKRPITPPLISKRLVRHCLDMTKKSREWMEQHPQEILENDYKKYPGKLDHTTVVACTVGCYDPANDKPSSVQSLYPEVFPF
jgi:serine/threonine protein phosphatase PrpC